MSRLQLAQEQPFTKKEQYVRESRKRCEAFWEQRPPLTLLEQLRLERTWALLEPLEGKAVADLGCGEGDLSRRLAKSGVKVTAVDVASNAFIQTHEGITFQRECLPYLTLRDESFDGIVMTDIIAELEPHLYRLLLSEAARLLKRGGWIVCSTPLDLQSIDALPRFLGLIETEFEILVERRSYYRLRFGWNRWTLRVGERISEILWGDGAVSHVILAAKKRAIVV